MPDYNAKTYARLKELLPSITDADTAASTRQYIRDYEHLNPQTQTSDLQLVQGVSGARPSFAALDMPTSVPKRRTDDDSGWAHYLQAHAARDMGTGPDPVMQRQAEMAAKTEADTQAAATFENNLSDLLTSHKGASKSRLSDIQRPSTLAGKPVDRSLGTRATSAGAPVYWDEPSFEQYQTAMRAEIGDAAYALDPKSPAFQVWKDRTYAGAYDRAKAAGVGIVRIASTPGSSLKKFGQRAQAAVGSGVGGLLHSYTLGASDALDSAVGGKRALEENALRREASPIAGTVGETAGLLSPGSVAEHGFVGISRAVEKVPGVRAVQRNLLGRVGVAAAKNAVAAETIGAAEDASSALARAAASRDYRELIPNSATGARATERWASGALLGAGAEYGAAKLPGRLAPSRELIAKRRATAEALQDYEAVAQKYGAGLPIYPKPIPHMEPRPPPWQAPDVRVSQTVDHVGPAAPINARLPATAAPSKPAAKSAVLPELDTQQPVGPHPWLDEARRYAGRPLPSFAGSISIARSPRGSYNVRAPELAPALQRSLIRTGAASQAELLQQLAEHRRLGTRLLKHTKAKLRNSGLGRAGAAVPSEQTQLQESDDIKAQLDALGAR